MAPKIEFQKSKKTVEWVDRFESLLELGRGHGVEIDSECEQGFCGTCKTRLVSGEVDMEVTDGLDDEDMQGKMILPCVAVPKGDIVLDA